MTALAPPIVVPQLGLRGIVKPQGRPMYASVRDIRMLRIEELNDLTPAVVHISDRS